MVAVLSGGRAVLGGFSSPCQHDPVNQVQSGPVERRGAIDVARSASLILVVVAHLVMVVLDRGPDGALRGVNLFEIHPGLEWLTMISPMPLFFVASGWANVGSPIDSRLQRTRTMLTLGTVLVVIWSLAMLTERLVTGDNGIIADGARISTQPMWFLTAWIPFTIGSSFLTRCSRRIVPVVGGCLGAMILIDVARFAFDAPRWIGFPGFFVAWAIPWLMGAWWRQRCDRADSGGSVLNERRIGVRIAAVAAATVFVLAVFLGYHVALIDAVPGNRSNTTPPTLFTAVASLLQVGLFMIAARSLDAVAARRAAFIRSLNGVAPGLYVWHLTSLTLWAALLAAGLWAPERLSSAWWLTRPIWFALVIAGAFGFSLATRSALSRGPGGATGPSTSGSSAPARLIVAAASAVVAFGLTGLYGPDTTGMAISISLLCVVSFVSLGSRSTRAGSILS